MSQLNDLLNHNLQGEFIELVNYDENNPEMILIQLGNGDTLFLKAENNMLKISMNRDNHINIINI